MRCDLPTHDGEQYVRPPARIAALYLNLGSVNGPEHPAQTTSTVGAAGLHWGEHHRALRFLTGLGLPHVSQSRRAAISCDVVAELQVLVQ